MALSLGLWLGFAPAIVAASAMATTMQLNMAGGGDSDDCSACPDMDENGGACKLICLNGGVTAPAASSAEHLVSAKPAYEAAIPEAPPSLAPQPDPAPPRHVSRL